MSGKSAATWHPRETDPWACEHCGDLRAGVERAYRDLRSDEIGGYSLERFDAAMSALLAESNG